ncbi:hypothetical protein KJ853_03360 [Patescibacteria group bacterium]|nr:hypothetical protein [Patescibacteria group bacterium]
MKKTHYYLIKIVAIISFFYGLVYIILSGRALYPFFYFLPSGEMKSGIEAATLQNYYYTMSLIILSLIAGIMFVVAGWKLFTIKKIGIYLFVSATILILLSTYLLENGIEKSWSGFLFLSLLSIYLIGTYKQFIQTNLNTQINNLV